MKPAETKWIETTHAGEQSAGVARFTRTLSKEVSGRFVLSVKIDVVAPLASDEWPDDCFSPEFREWLWQAAEPPPKA